MTDNIITRDEAIDRMKAELPCETLNKARNVWHETVWAHFDVHDVEFRRPPEPRRVAREWWIQIDEKGMFCGWSSAPISRFCDERSTHVREVLPGDVVLQRMTEADVRSRAHVYDQQAWVNCCKHFGLIGEGS